MAEKVLKGITCPACSGELDLREGVKTFNCKYCGSLLTTKGADGVVKYYVPANIQRNIAIQNTFNWLGKGLAKARGLKTSSKIEDAFLTFIPYWLPNSLLWSRLSFHYFPVPICVSSRHLLRACHLLFVTFGFMIKYLNNTCQWCTSVTFIT